jgi:hypothetical protein
MQVNIMYRIYSRISRPAYKSNWTFQVKILTKISQNKNTKFELKSDRFKENSQLEQK